MEEQLHLARNPFDDESQQSRVPLNLFNNEDSKVTFLYDQKKNESVRISLHKIEISSGNISIDLPPKNGRNWIW